MWPLPVSDDLYFKVTMVETIQRGSTSLRIKVAITCSYSVLCVKELIAYGYCCCCCWLLLYHSAILRSRADSLRSHVILHECFWISTEVVYLLTALAWLVPHETAAVSAQVLCTPYNHAPCHFTQSHIRKVYACLAVTCHLHFWQNDRDLLRATAVTRYWCLLLKWPWPVDNDFCFNVAIVYEWRSLP